MTSHIETLAIRRFRALQNLRIEGLGRVSLITGRNNTGKSSVLEALRILASGASPSVLFDILRIREEDSREAENPARRLAAESPFSLSSLFHDFPQFSATVEPIVIESSGGDYPLNLAIETGWFTEERMQDGTTRRVLQPPDHLDEDEVSPALVISIDHVKQVVPLSRINKYYRGSSSSLASLHKAQLRCMSVGPYGGERTDTLGALWDKIALSDREADVVEALRVIDSGIEAVSMVGVEGVRQVRTAIVRAKGLPRPVPLRSYGDGLNRLFGIVLSLVNAEDGLLLIDEFENGMHHSVQLDVWRTIFNLARRLDIQVVATSHSWDAIEAFQKAASEDPDEGVLIRLSRQGKDIIPTMFREDELAIATRDRIEVR